MPRTQGISIITNTAAGETYIGSSVDITRRWVDHRRELRTKKHKNKLLQSAYDRYGVNAFVIATLELVEQVEHLVCRE